MKISCTIFCVLLFCLTGATQNSFKFKAQVYHNKLGPQKNVSVLIDNQYPAVTNDAGVFSIGLPKNTNRVKISLSKSNYTILYPYGGLVLIPRDPNDVPQIIVGNIKDDENLKKYLGLVSLLKNKTAQSTSQTQELTKQIDSLHKTLIKFNYTEAQLQIAREIQEGKEDYLPEITGDLVDYKTKAADLKTAFKYVSDYAFENGSALERLATAVNNYNIAFGNLDKQHFNFEKRVADYWQDESLTADFKSLVAFALDTVHRQKIYPMQGTIGQIRDYLTKGNKNNSLKKSIQDNVSKFVQDLEGLLPRLESETNEISARLIK